MKIFIKLICFFLFLLVGVSVYTQVQKLTVFANKPTTQVSSTMWGVFFEDINFGADGGLYAELVKNRSFEFPMPLMGWKELRREGANGAILIENLGNQKPQNGRYAQITVNAPKGAYGISNEGFRGMGIHKDEQYTFSIWAKREDGNLKSTLELEDESGKKLGSATLQGFTNQWEKYSVPITSSDSASRAHLNVLWEGEGAVDVDMISLFPLHTWKNRPNGLRADLVKLLAELRPGFIRFPGGCIVEGRDLNNRYQWKNTTGPIEDRKLLMNRWNIEFPKRSSPDYFQTFGLGFFEYFQLAEDIGAEPLPILNCGMACQFNSAEVTPLGFLDPFIQDALDLIEFANGPPTSKWGIIRAAMGHPDPFHLKLMGVGNEQWDKQYIDRFTLFNSVLKRRHPEIKLVAAAGPSPSGKLFDYAWKELRKLNADLIDEHYYQNPEWFLKNANRYDNYDRKGPKVFAGEYAAHDKDQIKSETKNTWFSALAEAAFMTGLERNADIVQMASYAPLFAHVDAWQWRPDLIWFNNLTAIGTPNYYVQKLFSINRGTEVIPILKDGEVLEGKDSVYASSTIDKKKGTIIIKLVNAANKKIKFAIDIAGVVVSMPVIAETLTAMDLNAFNSIEQPNEIQVIKESLNSKNHIIQCELKPFSLYVINIPFGDNQ